ncbi:MAG TPA: sugar transferase, partial [Thermoleophilia bacterium]|nr:sugar transferase [Thermoleophilia bacterium]
MSIAGESDSAVESLVEKTVAREREAGVASVHREELPRIARWLIFTDIAVALAAYVLAVILRAETSAAQETTLVDLNWSMFLLLGLTFGLFYLLGLYEDEVFVSRPIHLWTLLRAMFYAFIVAAGIIYLAHLPIWMQSRLVLLGTFALFFAFAGVLRVGVLSRLYFKRVPRRSVATVVVGDANRTAPLRERLKELRVFNRVELLDTGCAGTVSAPWFKMMLWQTLRRSPVRVAHVFIDAPSLETETVLDMVGIARQVGAKVYVVSPLIRSLNARRLLFDLFEAPVVPLRRAPEEIAVPQVKRTFDILVSVVMLVLCSPLMLVLAVAIKLTSPGSVLYRQERIGRKGKPFTLYKFRSMRVANDP